MNRSLINYFSLVSLLALLAAGGCDEGNDTPSSATDPVEVNLFTKTQTDDTDAASSYRLLVFNTEGACVQNLSFVPGSGSVSLLAGNYSFATLTLPAGLALPAAGTTAGLTTSSRLAFDPDAVVQPFRLSPLTAVELRADGTSMAYTATLKPATGALSLHLSGMPGDKQVAFALKNMQTSVALDDMEYSGTAPYPLALNGETVCFPSDGNVMLSYQVGNDAVRTLDVGCALEAGNRLTVELAWKDDLPVLLLVSSTVTPWMPGNDGGETGSAE